MSVTPDDTDCSKHYMDLRRGDRFDILGQHCDRADTWLADHFGARLTQTERLSIRRVLFARAWQAKSEMDRAGSA